MTALLTLDDVGLPPPLPADRGHTPASTSEPVIDTEPSTLGVIEMLLKDQAALDRQLRSPQRQRDLIPRLLAVAMIGFAIFGLVATALLNAFYVQSAMWLPKIPAAHWNDLSAANLTLSYTLGLIAANGICLPSFYFYGLLAGIRITMLGVTAHALKGMAAGAVALVGLLPVYVAGALTALVFPGFAGGAMFWSAIALVLPFVAGLWGAFCLYQGFVSLADTMPETSRSRRECFLRRLIFAWCGCFTFVTPVVIYSLWSMLDGWTIAAI